MGWPAFSLDFMDSGVWGIAAFDLFVNTHRDKDIEVAVREKLQRRRSAGVLTKSVSSAPKDEVVAEDDPEFLAELERKKREVFLSYQHYCF